MLRPTAEERKELDDAVEALRARRGVGQQITLHRFVLDVALAEARKIGKRLAEEPAPKAEEPEDENDESTDLALNDEALIDRIAAVDRLRRKARGGPKIAAADHLAALRAELARRRSKG